MVSRAAAIDVLAVTPRPRNEYEIKFSVPLEQAHGFIAASQAWLRPKVYDEDLPVAFSRTTYLDTPDRRYLASSNGPVSRRLRIREYAGAPMAGAPARFTNLCYIEYKESMAGKRRKARIAMPPDDIAGILERPHGLIEDAGRLTPETRAAADVLVQELDNRWLSPQLTTWYRRQSLIDAEEHVRVTVDTEISFCHPIDLLAGRQAWQPERVAGYAHACLVEIKYQGAAPAWLIQTMGMLGEPPSVRLSKYAMGMQALDDAVDSKP